MALTETPPPYWDWSFWWRHFGKPAMAIGGLQDPYLLRYYILPRNPFVNLYLHNFLRSDDDRANHSHPWYAVSFILKSGYWEHRHGKVSWRKPGSINFLTPRTFHRVELDTEIVGGQHVEQPAWTLFATGPRRGRSWYFKCPKGLVEWRQFGIQDGCGEFA